MPNFRRPVLRRIVLHVFAASVCFFVPVSCGDGQGPKQTDHKYAEIFDQGFYHAVEEGKEAREVTSEHTIPARSTVSRALHDAGLSDTTVNRVLDASRKHGALERFRAGARFVVHWRGEDASEPVRIVFYRSATELLVYEADDDGDWDYWAETRTEDIVIKSFRGVVDTSLWESAAKAGMSSRLINALAEIFAWQLDFSRELKKGDRWRLAVEQRLVEGEVVGWGNVLVCEYQKADHTFTAVRFPQSGDAGSYYQPDGASLQAMFLKAPIRFARITSRFSSMRFHPVLKVSRPHNGVDYGAPTGTPIMAVGGGRVDFAAFNGESGRMIRIRHNETYQTEYKHLSRFAAGLKVGASIEQGEVIGYVGATGLATAPHLHFAFYEHGRYVDPLGLSFPSAAEVAVDQQEAFGKTSLEALKLLPGWPFRLF